MIVLVAGALVALHHLALWAESRGWLFYKHRKASAGNLGSAFLEVQSILEPGTKHVVESRLDSVAEEDESGDPPPEREGNGGVS